METAHKQRQHKILKSIGILYKSRGILKQPLLVVTVVLHS